METIEVIGAKLARIRKLEKGDILVVSSDDSLTQVQRGAIRLNLAECFPGHEVVILDNGKQLAIVRPEGEGNGVRQISSSPGGDAAGPLRGAGEEDNAQPPG